METAVDLLLKGYDASKAMLSQVYKLVDHFYDCTDIFDQSVSSLSKKNDFYE